MSTYMTIALSVIVILLALFRKSKPVLITPVIIVLVVFLISGAVARLFQTEERAERLNRDLFAEANGVMIGREIVVDLPDGGDVAVVRASPMNWLGSTVYEAEMDGLRQVLDKRKYPLHIVHQSDPTEDESQPEDLPERDYAALLKQVPNAKAVVLQRIVFEPDAGSQPSNYPPAYIIVGANGGLVDRLFAEGYARVVADYRTDADWYAVPTQKMKPEDVFGLRYQIKRR